MKGALKVLSGKQVAQTLAKFGFAIHSSSSSHLKLRRTSIGGRETLIIPSHATIARGTLRAIYNQACHYVPQAELRPSFYND
jgi:predicted RNA binding protein YcfA (HicA-like mRNA interferase family)